MLVIEKLRVRWRNLLYSNQVDEVPSESVFRDLLAAYSEPHRHYHTLEHIQHLFEELDNCENVSDEMLWAVWYHDIVYQPGAKNNEKRSADIADAELRDFGLSSLRIDKTKSLIIATQTHQSNEDIETQLFLDADMAILGSEPTTYFNYREAIRKEHANIPRLLFNRGRRKFLKSILKQKTIFLTPHFKNKYEENARSNIEHELSLG